MSRERELAGVAVGEKVLVVDAVSRWGGCRPVAQTATVQSIGAREVRLQDGSRWLLRNGNQVGGGYWGKWIVKYSDTLAEEYANNAKHNAALRRASEIDQKLRKCRVTPDNVHLFEQLLSNLEQLEARPQP